MDQKLSVVNLRGTPDRANDYIYVVNGSSFYRSTINNELGITGSPVGTTDSQTLTNKTFTAPTIASPVLNGTITGTYTFAGTPTFPATVVTTTGNQTLTNKVLTSPTINTPTVTNASITQDAVTGFTTVNSGTVYGVAFTLGKMSGASITNSTVGANQLATGASAALVATSETTTSTSYADLTTTTDTVTVTIGANGLALVTVSSYMVNNTADAFSLVSFAGSGANTITAADSYAIIWQVQGSNHAVRYSATTLLTGLAAGSTTFKMKYKVQTGGSGAGTGTFLDRRISVVPL